MEIANTAQAVEIIMESAQEFSPILNQGSQFVGGSDAHPIWAMLFTNSVSNTVVYTHTAELEETLKDLLSLELSFFRDGSNEGLINKPSLDFTSILLEDADALDGYDINQWNEAFAQFEEKLEYWSGFKDGGSELPGTSTNFITSGHTTELAELQEYKRYLEPIVELVATIPPSVLKAL